MLIVKMLEYDAWSTSMSSIGGNNTDFWKKTTNTESSADTRGSSVYTHPLYKLSHYIWLFGSPPILLVGNFGNIVTIIIMRRTHPGEAVVNIYFTAIAIVDLIILDWVFVNEWIGMAFGYWIHFQNDALCKIRNWTGGTTTVTSAWFLVSLTAHRAASVVWPHRVNAACTRRLVVGLVVGIAVVISAVYSQYLYGYQVRYFEGTKENMCILFPEQYAMFVQQVFTYIYLTIYCLLPFSCIIVANCVLIWKLRATIREMRHKFAEKDSAAAREKAASSVTLTVITVSIAYIMLTLPATVYFVTFYVFDYSATMSVYDYASSYLIRAVVFMLVYSNHSINFYLYCLTGAKFRLEFVKLFQCKMLKHTQS